MKQRFLEGQPEACVQLAESEVAPVFASKRRLSTFDMVKPRMGLTRGSTENMLQRATCLVCALTLSAFKKLCCGSSTNFLIYSVGATGKACSLGVTMAWAKAKGVR
jgi:hypothetical protein